VTHSGGRRPCTHPRSGDVGCKLLYSVYLLTYLLTLLAIGSDVAIQYRSDWSVKDGRTDGRTDGQIRLESAASYGA